jgi:hypothetical protein
MADPPAWRIYYRDGRVFDSLDGEWRDAPSEGVLAVVENRAGTVTVHSGHDYYQLDDDTVVMHDERTLLAAIGIVEMLPIKFGWYTNASRMERTLVRIRQDWGL